MLTRSRERQNFFREQGIESVSSGLITMRRRIVNATRVNVGALKDAPEKIGRPCGDAVARLFAVRGSARFPRRSRVHAAETSMLG